MSIMTLYKDLIYHVYIKNKLLKLNYLLLAKREEWKKKTPETKQIFHFLAKNITMNKNK